MEDVLEQYALAYDPKRPLVCVDERPCQLLSDSRAALPMQAGQPARYDYEYVRQGMCNLFMVFEPVTGWRGTTVTPHRKQEDFAYLMSAVVGIHFPQADIMCVVMENLNLHSPASLKST